MQPTLSDLAVSGGYGTLYIDPPWRYGNASTKGSASKEYPTMSFHQIAALPIPDLAAKRSHLHLWTTNTMLPEALKLLTLWGFEYKGVFVWIKPRLGLGNYYRISHEFLVLGVKGRLRFRTKSARSWLMCGLGRHSAKPERVRQMIEANSPEPRLELFGRRQVPGWTVWGDQIEKELFDKESDDA